MTAELSAPPARSRSGVGAQLNPEPKAQSDSSFSSFSYLAPTNAPAGKLAGPLIRGNLMTTPLIVIDPDIQSGAPVFAGTRVPIQNLFDYLEEGDSLDIFLKQFPSVTRPQAVAILEQARASLVADAHLA